jgi:two-component system, NarL family, nitrate/nitrite response regulator NarL
MRILICDYHVLFAESLAYLLMARGKQVVAVTHHPDQAASVLRYEPVDVWVLDVQYGPESAVDRLAGLRMAAPRTRIVLLAGQVDDALRAAAHAAGVHGVADKRQPVAEIIDLLDRVHAGRPVPAYGPIGGPVSVPRQRPANDAQRLAAFLTPRERQVLSALVCGEDTTKLARSLGIAATTARCHIQSVLTKMGAHSRLEVATTAVRFGMVSPETGEWLLPVT